MEVLTDILQLEKDARAESDTAYEAKKVEWENANAQYQAMRDSDASGDTVARIAGLVRKFGPGLATKLGLPGAAAGLVALSANEGAFSGVLTALKSVLGF